MASARQIRDEIMKMTIVVNSDPAQKAIYDLSKKNQELKEKNDALSGSMKEVRSTLGKNSDEYKKLTSELNQNKLAISANEREMERLRGEMDISQMTMSQLRKEAALLRTNLTNMVPGSEASQRLQQQLDAVNARMNQVRTGASKTSLSFRELADRFNHYSGVVVAGAAVLAGFAVSVQQIIDRNNKMADAMSGVEKTTGLARSEVEELTRSFSDFDTRTKKIDLLKIAEVGGRLGVAKSEIKDFTQEVDKAYVALGDSWQGGVDKLADSMGRIAGLYSETKNQPIAQSINEVGSALNELAAQGASSEQNIAEFVTRMGSVPEALRPSLNELLGFGSALEESGINAEIGASGLSKFLRVASNNVKGFADVMKLPVQQVRDLINSNPAEFFLQFSEGLKGMDADQLAGILDYLKLNDNEVTKIIGAASDNTDRFRESVELASKAVAEGTSLQNEFNKVNNNAAAVYEKVQRKIAEAFTSRAVADFINDTVTAFGKFLGVVEDADGYITGFRNTLMFLVKTITLVMVTMVSYNLLTGVYNGLMVTAIQRVIALTVVEKARNVVTGIGTALASAYRAALWLLAAGYSLLRGQTAQATFAMTAFNTAVRANPIGLFITLLIATVTAVQLFSKETNKAANAQKTLNDVMKEGVKNAAEEVGKLDQLYKAATNVALGKEAQLKAAKELIKLWPEQFKAGTEELIMNGKMANSYYAVRDAIIAASRAKAAQAEIDKINAEYLQKEEEIKQKMLEQATKARTAGGTQTVNAGPTGAVVTYSSSKENQEIAKNRFREETKNLALLYKERNKVLEPYIKVKYKEDQKSSILNPADVDPGSAGFGAPSAPTNSSSSTAAKRESDRLKREQEAYDKMLLEWKAKGEISEQLARQIELDISDARIEAMEDGFLKEMIQLSLQEERKKAEIDKKKIGATEFEKLDAAAKKAKKEDKYIFEALKESWLKNNEELEKEKETQIAIFSNKREAIQYKYEKKHLDNLDNLHQTALGRLKREQNEELATYSTLEELKEGLKGRMNEKERTRITTWAEGKEALNKIYLKRELELQVAHLESMVKLYEGLDLGILTPEQREAVMKFIEEAGNKIAEFRAKIKGEEQNDKGPKKISQKGSTDVLGMSLDDWDAMFMNLKNGTDMLGTMIAAVGALQNAFGAYYQYVEANEKRQLQTIERNTERKKKSLKNQLDTGHINQETYKKLTIKADQDLDKKKAEIAMKQAKREKQMAIVSTLMNTAQAIMGIWAQFPKFDFGATAAIMSGVVGALGALQVATIISQPLPSAEGYEDGFGMEYPIERQQDGKRFNVRRSRLKTGPVDRPTHFIAGENNKLEMVIDNPTWTTYSPQLKSAIHSANARAKGFESGFNTNAGNTTTSSASDEIMIKMMSVLVENTQVMREIKETGITAIIGKTARNGKEIDEMRQEYLDLKNKNKH